MQKQALGRVALFAIDNTFTRALAKRLFDDKVLELIVQPLPRVYRHEAIIFEAAPQENPSQLASEYENKVPLRFVGDASQTQLCDLLQRLKIDTLIVSFFNQLLRKPVLDAVAQRAFNFHPSLLPKLRGPAPIFWTIKEGAKQSGMTLHQLDLGEDTGPIVYQTPPLFLDDKSDVSTILNHAEAHIDDALHALQAQDRYRAQAGVGSRAPRPDAQSSTFSAQDEAQEALRIFHALKSAYRFYVQVEKERFAVQDARSMRGYALPKDVAHVLLNNALFLQMKGGIVKFSIRC